MNIRQFNLQYSPEEDRILFRINTMSEEEFRFSLTRRFVKLLWPILQDVLNQDYKNREPDKAHIAKDMVEFEREEVVSGSDFQQQYDQEEKTCPLGTEYILLSRIQVKRNSNNNILCLHSSDGIGIELAVTNVLLHNVCKMLADTFLAADWDLDALLNRQGYGSVIEETSNLVH